MRQGEGGGPLHQAGSVNAQMNFVVAAEGDRRVARVYEPDGTSHHPLQPQALAIANARRLAGPSLAREGFELVRWPTALKDFRDDDELRAVYVPEMKRLVQAMTGAHEVVMIPHVGRRIADDVARASSDVQNALEAAQFVHLDYSAESVWAFLARAIGETGVDPARYSRIVTYNLWRALSPPPQDTPLALCDMRSTSLADLVTAKAEFAGRDTTFDISLVRHRPSHRWYYYPALTADEVIVFKCWTLKPSPEPAVFHSSFRMPGEDTIPRVSIEARAFALWE